jgi:hypothetical protein
VSTVERDLAFGGFPRSVFARGVYVGDLLQADPFGFFGWLETFSS